MKVGLIIGNDLWLCPYATIYSDALNKLKIEYDIISWNRDGKKDNTIQFDYTPSHNTFSMLLSYYKFASFVKKTVFKNKYDRLIVFTPQVAIFLALFLRHYYSGRYIFDYRDLSIEQNKLFKCQFRCVLDNSFANVISSPGFKQYLPQGYNYILSHNFNIDEVHKALSCALCVTNRVMPIDILTIGGIRDYESNVKVIDSLANVPGFSVRFVGKGPAASILQQRAIELNAQNVSFEGYYPKEKEKDYIKDTTFINIFYPRKPSHDTAISNRFYNALIYRKPMIATKNSTQGDYIEKYHLGVAIDDCNDLSLVLRNCLASIEENTFVDNCNRLLREFLSDYEEWERMVKRFIG